MLIICGQECRNFISFQWPPLGDKVDDLLEYTCDTRTILGEFNEIKNKHKKMTRCPPYLQKYKTTVKRRLVISAEIQECLQKSTTNCDSLQVASG